MDPLALQIMLFYDELELCNPLGSSTKVHKLGKLKLIPDEGNLILLLLL